MAPEVLDVGVFLWSSARTGLRRFFFSENRADVHEAVWTIGSGLVGRVVVHKKQLLPVLVVWAPPRKRRNEEQHALNGDTLASAASSSWETIPGHQVEEAQ